MIDYIVGKVSHIGEDYLLLECNGIGYKINTSTNTLLETSRNSDYQKIFTNLIVREDGIFLYGFVSEEEIEVFKFQKLVL